MHDVGERSDEALIAGVRAGDHSALILQVERYHGPLLGYLPQEFGDYSELTGRRFLRYLAAMKGLPDELARRRVDELLERAGAIAADTTAEALIAGAIGSIWSTTTDAATGLRLQASCQVSAMVTDVRGTTLRLISPVRPHDGALAVEPTLEDAYLLAVGETTSVARP